MNNPDYANSLMWRQAAMLRPSSISHDEIKQRREIAKIHNSSNQISDADQLMDQELYILGKMPLEEYQRYLLFKHTEQIRP